MTVDRRGGGPIVRMTRGEIEPAARIDPHHAPDIEIGFVVITWPSEILGPTACDVVTEKFTGRDAGTVDDISHRVIGQRDEAAVGCARAARCTGADISE